MTTLTYGSLFSGYGGLDMGVQSALGGRTAWHCEVDPAVSRILAHHWPHVPNLGDITTVDWTAVEPVDVITGGSPCQDLSHAGKRLGMRPGTRSGLWASMCDAIDIIRPRLVVWENVRGALSAGADSAVEPCPLCVGDDGETHLRALGRVVGDLSELRYDAWWVGVRAADAGAPHGRFRVFVFAWPAPTEGRRPRADAGRRGGASAAADTSGDGWDERRPEPARVVGGPDATQRGDAPTPDAGGQRHGRRLHPGDVGRVDGEDASRPQQRERAREVPGDRSAAAAADSLGGGRRDGRARHPRRGPGGRAAAARGGKGDSGATVWGDYGPAIRRWEAILGRLAPPPTEPGKTGAPRLSPRFVEWMMGLPAGHVTDVTDVPGLSRNDQLKALGNGVVPQQAALATRMFLAARAGEAAA